VKITVVTRQPDGAAFDIVLILHVACVVVGLATTITSAATASRLRTLVDRSSPLPESMARYFKQGVNWAGRIVYGIPIFGFALLAMSQGAYSLHDTWVMLGLALFVVVVLLGEGVLWPAERRVQGLLVTPIAEGTPADAAVLGDLKVMNLAAVGCVVLLLLGSGIMLAQP
jgi:uncharacterized membrane protein